MKYGLYERILNNNFIEEIDDENYKKIRKIDNSEVARVLSIEYQKKIRETLLQINSDEDKVDFIEKLNKL